jgi:hypothetical protein
VSRILAWTLFAATAALLAVGAALIVAGQQRGFETHDSSSWTSQFLIIGIGGTAALLTGAVGIVIALTDSRNAIAWIFLCWGCLLAAIMAGYGYADWTIYDGKPWPGSSVAAAYVGWSFIPAVFVAPALVAQLFPNGRALGGRWRWAFGITVAIGAQATLWAILHPGPTSSFSERTNPLGAPGELGNIAAWLDDHGSILAIPVYAASLASLGVRFRRSAGVERQQMKLLAFAGALPVAAFGLSFAWQVVGGQGLLNDVLFITGFTSLGLIPVAVGVAIRRYRLYEIDRVISRTLVYGSLTVVLGAAYVGLVLAGQAVFSSFAGGSNLAIAVSTLVVAALFRPVRSRVQEVVDRRFYRHRYDAQQTLDAFSTRLRHQVELSGLCADLQAVVDETVQPQHVSLWLRD